jgi:hypothetical protein
MSVRMWPAAKDLPVFAQMAVRLLDALDERLPARSRPSNTGSFRNPLSAERALRIYSHEPVAARPDVEVSRGISSSHTDLRNRRLLKLGRSNVTIESTRFVLANFTSPIVDIPAYKMRLPRFLVFWIASERKEPWRLSRLL